MRNGGASMESDRKIRALLLSPIYDDPTELPPMGLPVLPAPERAICYTAPRPAQAWAG